MQQRTEAQWHALFSEHKQSGLSMECFCRERGLSPSYFCTKRGQLVPARRTTESSASAFIPVLRTERPIATTHCIRWSYKNITLQWQGRLPAWLSVERGRL